MGSISASTNVNANLIGNISASYVKGIFTSILPIQMVLIRSVT
jgi:hypothetical protein